MIDGYHRWTAHKKVEAERIAVTVTSTASDAELLGLAIERNAGHGLQLSQKEKKALACRLYSAKVYDKGELSRLLKVSPRSLNDWLHDIDKSDREERNRRIFDMWLACHTGEEIGDLLGIHKDTVSAYTEECRNLENLPKSDKLDATHSDRDWKPPLYTVWTFGKKSNEVGHFGNSEQRILDNLLYLYTEPFDIVLDPFAGGGSTIDVCKRRLRRYYVSDRKPTAVLFCWLSWLLFAGVEPASVARH